MYNEYTEKSLLYERLFSCFALITSSLLNGPKQCKILRLTPYFFTKEGITLVNAASFRFVSTLITLLLMAAIVGVIALVISDAAESGSSDVETMLADASSPQNSQSESNIDNQIDATLAPDELSGSTNADDLESSLDESKNSAHDRLEETRQVETGQFEYQPIQAYAISVSGTSVNLTAADAVDDTGPVFVLNGTTPQAFEIENVGSIEETFEEFLNNLAQSIGFRYQPAQTYSSEKISGLISEITHDGVNPYAGRIFMAQPNADRLFIMVGISPVDRWAASVSDEYNAVLSSVSLLDVGGQTASEESISKESAIEESGNERPAESVVQTDSPQPTAEVAPSTNPTSTPASSNTNNSTDNNFTANNSITNSSETGATDGQDPLAQNQFNQLAPVRSQWQIFSNTNYVNDLAFFDNLIWAATDGGVVAWNPSGGAAAKFTTQNGLALNVSTSAEACPLPGLGLIIGTAQGLQILNLQDGTWITLNSSNSLMSFDDVVALHCDPVNRFLIIGYERNGLDIYDAAANTWTRVDQSSGLTTNLVDRLAVVGNRSEIWIASSFGVNVLENVRTANNQRSSFFSPQNSPLTSNRINDIAASTGDNPDGTVWLIEDDKLFKVKAGEQSIVGSTQRDWWVYNGENVRGGQFPSGRLVSLDVAADGTVWIGSEQGELCRFDPIGEQCSEFTTQESEIDSATGAGSFGRIHVTDDGGVYFTTAGNGFVRYQDGVQEQFILSDELLKGNHIRAIAQDSNGIVWIASDYGIQQIDLDDLARGEAFTSNSADRFRQINSNLLGDDLLGQDIQTLASDGKQGMWLGANGAGYFDGSTWRIYKQSDKGLIGSPVQAITVDALGRSWLGTPTGLSILNDDEFYNLTQAEGLPTENILSLLADNRDNRNIVWIGTNGGGLLRFENNQLRIFNRENANMPSNSITALATEVDGTLLVGTTRGLARFGGERASEVRSVGTGRITAIATHANTLADGAGNGNTAEEISENEIWVGTEQDGIFFYNGYAWEQLAVTDSLPSREISSILIDRSGSVWIGGVSGGIARYTP